MEHKQWLPNIEDLNSMPKEAYELIYKEAKEIFEETISHSEDITSKSIKLASVVILTAPFIVGLMVNHICMWYIILLIAAYVINFIILLRLLFPRAIIIRGFEPKNIFEIPLSDQSYSSTERILSLYYGIIIKLQDGITYNKSQNSNRVKMYRNALIISTVLFIVGVSIGLLSHL